MAEQPIIVQQHGHWYTDRWWVGCYIWYSEEGPGRAAYYSMWRCIYLRPLKG